MAGYNQRKSSPDAIETLNEDVAVSRLISKNQKICDGLTELFANPNVWVSYKPNWQSVQGRVELSLPNHYLKQYRLILFFRKFVIKMYISINVLSRYHMQHIVHYVPVSVKVINGT